MHVAKYLEPVAKYLEPVAKYLVPVATIVLNDLDNATPDWNIF